MGGAVGLAVLASLADWRTNDLGRLEDLGALTSGYHLAFVVGAICAARPRPLGRRSCCARRRWRRRRRASRSPSTRELPGAARGRIARGPAPAPPRAWGGRLRPARRSATRSTRSGGCTSSRRARRFSSRACPGTTGTSSRASASPTRRRSSRRSATWPRSTTSSGLGPGSGPERTVLGGFSMGAVMSYATGLDGGRPRPAGILAFSGLRPGGRGLAARPRRARRACRSSSRHGRSDPVIGVGFGHAGARPARAGRPRRRVPRARRRARDPPGSRCGRPPLAGRARLPYADVKPAAAASRTPVKGGAMADQVDRDRSRAPGCIVVLGAAAGAEAILNGGGLRLSARLLRCGSAQMRSETGRSSSRRVARSSPSRARTPRSRRSRVAPGSGSGRSTATFPRARRSSRRSTPSTSARSSPRPRRRPPTRTPGRGLTGFLEQVLELQARNLPLRAAFLRPGGRRGLVAERRRQIVPLLKRLVDARAASRRAARRLHGRPTSRSRCGRSRRSSRRPPSIAPDAWRRHLRVLLDGMRPAAATPQGRGRSPSRSSSAAIDALRNRYHRRRAAA